MIILENKKLLSKNEFEKIRNQVLKNTYAEIQENIFSKYWCNWLEFEKFPSLWKISYPLFWWNEKEIEKIKDIVYLYHHTNSSYWDLMLNLKLAIKDSHITCVDYKWYLVFKINYLRLSFILWLSCWDSIKNILEKICETNLSHKDEIRYFIDKYSNFKYKKEDTLFLDFTDFKSFPIFKSEKWKMTFRDFANDLKHNDDLLTNLSYELITENTIKERKTTKEENWRKTQYSSFWGIKTNMDDFNKFYYDICLQNLVKGTNDLSKIMEIIIKYLKEENRLKQYFN